MAKKRSQRSPRELVRDREKLAAATAGGAPERPIGVDSSAVIEGRARAMPCPQCEGELVVRDHRSERGLRAVDVRCTRCHVARTLWFRIDEPN
jgi:hypothetical protein